MDVEKTSGHILLAEPQNPQLLLSYCALQGCQLQGLQLEVLTKLFLTGAQLSRVPGDLQAQHYLLICNFQLKYDVAYSSIIPSLQELGRVA
jgi:hypothetical protein